MEDEIIITAIATGFDSETYHQQEVSLDNSTPASQPTTTQEPDVDEEMVKNIDMELDREDVAENFASENEENIWTEPVEDKAQEEENDMPAFLRRRKKKKESQE